MKILYQARRWLIVLFLLAILLAALTVVTPGLLFAFLLPLWFFFAAVICVQLYSFDSQHCRIMRQFPALPAFSPRPRRNGRRALHLVSRAALLALQKSYDVEMTYTSNAIEGNTLTLRETAEVIEHGITAGGKSLRDHLEAVDHYNAVLWMRDLAAKTTP